MTYDRWRAVDDYIVDHLVGSDDALDAALAASVEAGLPPINVAPNQGKLLQFLARLVDARRVLEIGTLGGYSTIWLARGLADGGTVVTLEVDPAHAAVAEANFVRAGVTDQVDLRIGAALDTLPKLVGEGGAPFDLVFIDADKQSNAEYFGWSLRMTRPGSLIVVDNVVREGRLVDPADEGADVEGTRRLYERMANEPAVSATAVQTVGVKGYDGFAVALVTGDAA